jgi:hypothetical protein
LRMSEIGGSIRARLARLLQCLATRHDRSRGQCGRGSLKWNSVAHEAKTSQVH